MPKERKKVLCMDAQRHAEYYGMQQTFDKLYAKSKAGEVFNGLMELALIRQLWALGIQDKQLLFVIKRILKAPIRNQADFESAYSYAGWQHGISNKRNTAGWDYLPAAGKRGAERT